MDLATASTSPALSLPACLSVCLSVSLLSTHPPVPCSVLALTSHRHPPLFSKPPASLPQPYPSPLRPMSCLPFLYYVSFFIFPSHSSSIIPFLLSTLLLPQRAPAKPMLRQIEDHKRPSSPASGSPITSPHPATTLASWPERSLITPTWELFWLEWTLQGIPCPALLPQPV